MTGAILQQTRQSGGVPDNDNDAAQPVIQE